jgi:hypothetical protein
VPEAGEGAQPLGRVSRLTPEVFPTRRRAERV